MSNKNDDAARVTISYIATPDGQYQPVVTVESIDESTGEIVDTEAFAYSSTFDTVEDAVAVCEWLGKYLKKEATLDDRPLVAKKKDIENDEDSSFYDGDGDPTFH